MLNTDMIMTTTPHIEGHKVTTYHGVITGEVIMGAYVALDSSASVPDIKDKWDGTYAKKLADATKQAMQELQTQASDKGANAVIGIDLNHQLIGTSTLMVSATGTAVSVGKIS